jgi:protein-disulfide isomerase
MHKKFLNWHVLATASVFFLGGLIIGSVNIFEGGNCDVIEAIPTAEDTTAEAPTVKNPTAEESIVVTQGVENGYFFIGDTTAPVTIVEYTDYQCPFCQRFFYDAYQQIQSAYVNTGKVKYVFKDYPLTGHAKARPATYAAKCAGEQGNFTNMHEKLFTYQSQWSYSSEHEDLFKNYAKELNLDMDKFTTCYEEAPSKYDEAIGKSMAEAISVGVSGTPSFTINGQLIVGAQKFNTFSQIIDSEL